MKERPIGLFDSGIGGLTVVKEVARLLPNEKIVYFGDTARVPYGEKSPETVRRFALEIADFLLECEIKALVVACNTASAYALQAIQQRSPIPTLGVLSSGVAACAALQEVRHIGVIGTRGTIHSRIYQKLLKESLPEAQVTALPCPLFVPLAEEAYWEEEATRLIARSYLSPLRAASIDTLVLGCTHYPLLRSVIQEAVGSDVRLVDSATATAQQVATLLGNRNLLRQEGTGSVHCFVSDNPDRFRTVGSLFLGRPIDTVTQPAASSPPLHI